MRILRFTHMDIYKGHLILINPSHPLKTSVPEQQLVPVCSDFSQILLEQQTAKMLADVMKHLGCDREIIPVSGYRTMREQQFIYNNSVRENGEVFTRQYVAIPGCSEHQTGLAIDLAENGDGIDFIRPDFSYTGICGSFRELSIQYGFIERYPFGCEQITGIGHEPWHFRYVGYPHSEVMKEMAFTLEEYTDYLKRYLYANKHLHLKCNLRNFEIFYVPVGEKGNSEVSIPGGIPFQVSGNNDDGVVITLWGERP
jgi:D-alanyl-D-alanine dipeptidase/carboxypeptidase